MRAEEFANILGDIREDYIAEAAKPAKPRRKHYRAAGLAAACLAIFFTAISLIPKEPPKTVEDTADTQDGAPSFQTEDATYIISPYLVMSNELPLGYEYAGTYEEDNVAYDYYLDPAYPQHAFVYQEVRTDGTVDENGTLTQTEPHMAYVQYVDSRLRGLNLISVKGTLYVTAWAADSAEDDGTEAFINEYGTRIEGTAPEGFTYLGKAAFSGYDTIPEGDLSSNTGEEEIWIDPDDDSVILVSTIWHTSPDNTGEETHYGFHVYTRYAGDLENFR